MNTTKKNFNEMRPTKTKTKLMKVNEQLNNLDKEINSIQKELNISKSFSSDNLLDDVTLFPKNKKSYRLYKNSVEVMNKRAENQINEEEAIDIISKPRTKIHIEGYRPPSQRIYDVSERKIKIINQIQEENERKINDNCTFRPKINQMSKEIRYDPSHLMQPKKRQNSPSSEPKDKKNKNTEKVGIGIYERQIQKNIYHQPEKVKGNVISPKSEKNMIERLTKPRENLNNQQKNPNECKNYATKQGITRLVANSIKRSEPEREIKQKPKQHMNKKSKEITKNVKVDLYEEYLDAKERIRQKNNEVMEWRQLTEQNENKNNEQVRFKKIKIDPNVPVAGMDDFVDRMNSRPVKKVNEKIPKVHPGIIAVKPFNFEIRDELKKKGQNHEDLLFEIDDIIQKI